MQRHRVLAAFAIAWLTALLLSWWLYQKTTAPEPRPLVFAVAAGRDLPVGKRIEQSDLKLISLDRKDVPRGVLLEISDGIDRTVAVPIAAGELILNSKVAAKGSGEGLTALIEPGKRAISVQVNEISGVSGFVQPGTRVDVLFTRVFSNGDAASTTILQNIKVIAYGRQLDSGAKVDPRDTSKPTVATLLVTQEEAEKLALAGQRGRIQLALRNALDDEIVEFAAPVQASDLGIDDPRKPQPVPIPRAAAGRKSVTLPVREDPAAAGIPNRPENNRPVVIKIYRGEKVTEETFH